MTIKTKVIRVSSKASEQLEEIKNYFGLSLSGAAALTLSHMHDLELHVPKNKWMGKREAIGNTTVRIRLSNESDTHLNKIAQETDMPLSDVLRTTIHRFSQLHEEAKVDPYKNKTVMQLLRVSHE